MAITAIATGETSDHLAAPPSPPSGKIASPPARDLETDTLHSAGVITPAVAGPVVGTTGTFSGTVSQTAANSKLVPGATSWSLRNNADSQDNFKVLDNGNATARGDIAGVAGTFSGAVSGTTGAFSSTVTATGVLAPNVIAAVTGDGAIAIAAQNKIYMVTKAGVAAMTIVDPTATTHDGVTLTFIAATANAHTLSNAAGSGFFSSGGSSKDVATFGGAIGDGLTIIAYQGKWYIDPRGVTNITLG